MDFYTIRNASEPDTNNAVNVHNDGTMLRDTLEDSQARDALAKARLNTGQYVEARRPAAEQPGASTETVSKDTGAFLTIFPVNDTQRTGFDADLQACCGAAL